MQQKSILFFNPQSLDTKWSRCLFKEVASIYTVYTKNNVQKRKYAKMEIKNKQ